MAIRVLGSYSDILSRRGSVRFVVAGWFARLSRSTTAIGTVLLVSAASGSYAIAGAVSGAIVVGIALTGWLWARAIDARGQTIVAAISLAASLVAAAALALTVVLGAPVWTWFVSAFLVGATSVDFGTLTRARWSAVLSDPSQRHTSLALESVADESVYVIGPPLVTVLAALVNPLFGFATGVVLAILGGVALAIQRSTAPPIVRHEGGRPPRSGMLPRGVLGVLPIYAGVGLLFASVDVSAVAISRELGIPFLAGVIVACFAFGSALSGFLFGPVSAHWPTGRRVLVATLAFAVVTPTLLVVHDVVILALVIFVAGLVTSPVLISSISLIEIRTQRHRLTEALTWPSVGLAVGITLGATLSGIAIDGATGFAGYLVAALGAVVVGVFGILGALVDRRAPAREPELQSRA
ncbi:MFS transporter [Lacisediminihabitans changchengi]|uniref:MFS transporter n=1 Tax=Lacisediminihabitans changchengi TaxID=2787634 RepID=A0A934SUD0_9MICO|nr:MFS transporter [Lacisediminihabitans changchengi]MBK4349085.1 MFS transporter [Lacisediminihabitans changchengi]